MEEKELRRFSRVVVDGVEQAPSRAMLRAVGFDDADTAVSNLGAKLWNGQSERSIANAMFCNR